MRLPLKEGTAWAAAAVLSLPAFLIPIYNPDLFWHLSAGRWILEHHDLPRADWLSFTRTGAPWCDFEWLSQLIFTLAFDHGGFFALWLLKGALLLATWFALNGALKVDLLPGLTRAAGLVLWSTAALMQADIRPELFSLLFFAVLLRMLERLRLGRREIDTTVCLWTAVLFAVWADLHLGFLFAFALIVCYGSAALLSKEKKVAWQCAKLLIFAVGGSFINPYGWQPYLVAWQHWNQGAELARYLAEWRMMSTRNPAYWPFWLLLGLTLSAAGSRFKNKMKGASAWTPFLAAAGLAAASLRHERAAPFFSLAAVLCICLSVTEHNVWSRRVRRGALLACAAFAVWLCPRFYRSDYFNDKFVPRLAAEFIDRENGVFSAMRVYNPWEWGGYLGFRLAPWYKVFDDGRYIFHDMLPRESAAVADFKAWKDFIDRQSIDAVLLQNIPKYFPTTKAYPDGRTRSFDRPYYLFYAPSAQWALVHWDDQALLFVRRSMAPARWLKAHEYRYVRPGDDAAFEEALTRREIPKDKVALESLRHRDEIERLERAYKR